MLRIDWNADHSTLLQSCNQPTLARMKAQLKVVLPLPGHPKPIILLSGETCL